MKDSPATRLYYRHVREGHLGYLVRDNGQDYIQFDRGAGDPVLRIFRPQDWIAENEPRPLSDVMKTRIAYAADQELCRALSQPGQALIPWLSLGDDARIAFMRKGPAGPIRQALYCAIMAQLNSGV